MHNNVDRTLAIYYDNKQFEQRCGMNYAFYRVRYKNGRFLVRILESNALMMNKAEWICRYDFDNPDENSCVWDDPVCPFVQLVKRLKRKVKNYFNRNAKVVITNPDRYEDLYECHLFDLFYKKDCMLATATGDYRFDYEQVTTNLNMSLQFWKTDKMFHYCLYRHYDLLEQGYIAIPQPTNRRSMQPIRKFFSDTIAKYEQPQPDWRKRYKKHLKQVYGIG